MDSDAPITYRLIYEFMQKMQVWSEKIPYRKINMESWYEKLLKNEKRTREEKFIFLLTESKILQEVIGEYFVYTVWLGGEHWNKNLFETIVFKDEEIMYLERYENLYQAIQRHDEIKKDIETGKNDWTV